jgi:23S rRNA (adenine2030-N6)-methyltransferase
MNYQHAFHAGNFADVHKHVVLVRILEYLRQKPAAFRVIDTHAGCGRYDLFGPEAERAQEWRNGIGRIFAALRTNTYEQQEVVRTGAAQILLAPYLDIVAAFNRDAKFRDIELHDGNSSSGNPIDGNLSDGNLGDGNLGGRNLSDGSLRFYPGSPLIALALMRRQDRLIACELELRAAASLKAALRAEPRAKMLAIDGWMALNANVPPKERRGLVLVDPPYEDATDFSRLSSALAEAHRKWPTGIYLLWYPIKERHAADGLARRLRKLTALKILRCEMLRDTPRADAGLIGSGLIIVNPPYTLQDELRIMLPALGNLLRGNITYRLDWLAQEAAHSKCEG